MALRPIVQIEIPLPERAGSIIQGEALAPFTERHRGDYWDFDRHPFAHLRSWAAAGSPAELKLPREPGAPPAPRPPAAAAAPARGRATRAIGTPETLAWGWVIFTVPIAAEGDVPCVTTPAIPWPFRIVGFTLNSMADNDTMIAQLWNTDHDVGAAIAKTNPYTPLLPVLHTVDASIAVDGWGWRMASSAAAAEFHRMTLATSVLGATVLEAGRHVTIGIKGLNTDGANFSGTITIERADVDTTVEADVRPRALRAIAPPRPPAAPRPPAPARPALPRIGFSPAARGSGYAGPAKKMVIF